LLHEEIPTFHYEKLPKGLTRYLQQSCLARMAACISRSRSSMFRDAS
jgi:hypothetical protein